MKLVVLGGAGDMGSFVVRDSVKYGSIWTNITIADLNEDKAKAIIRNLKDPRLNFLRVDATNHTALVELLKIYDIAISTIGPFYIFGPLLVKAAIEAQTPLVDINDDFGPTLEVLALDDAAKEAGIPIFLGYGWTPGLTNLMARYAYDKLDKNYPIEFDISWAGGAADSEGLAVIMHVLYAVTGKVPSFQNGQFIEVPAGKGNVKVDFPPPLGTIGLFDCGHPEPVTIPKFLPNVTRCTLKGGLTPDWNNKFAESMKQLHLTQGSLRKKILAKLVHWTESLFATGGIAASAARVDIKGVFEGNEIHWVYSTPSIIMGKLTGYPASITAQLFAQKKIVGVGTLPPEALPTNVPQLIFDEMKRRNIEMVFDEAKPLQTFTPSQPYTPNLISRYGMTILILLILFSIIWLLMLGLFSIF